MPTPESLSRSLIDAAFELRRALREYMDTAGVDETLPEAQSDVLRDVAAHPGTRIGEVASRLSLRPNTVSTLVGILVDKGLIARGPDPQDGRASVLRMTDERGARRDRRSEKRIDALTTELERLPARDRAALERTLPILVRVNANLREHAPRRNGARDSE